jgi:hypothetical protein
MWIRFNFIELDILPVDDNKVMNVTQNKLSVLASWEDENVEEHFTQAEKLQHIMSEEEEKKNYHQWISSRQSLQHYPKLFMQKQRYFAWPENDLSECFDWEILSDQEPHIDTVFMPPTSSNVIKSSIDIYAPLEQNVFEYFPLCQRSDPRATLYNTVKSHNICFFDDSDPDPDWKMKQCYLLIIAASTELDEVNKT